MVQHVTIDMNPVKQSPEQSIPAVDDCSEMQEESPGDEHKPMMEKKRKKTYTFGASTVYLFLFLFCLLFFALVVLVLQIPSIQTMTVPYMSTPQQNPIEVNGIYFQDFLLRYKRPTDHWIGLWREGGQPWKWANGSSFNNWFKIGADGPCAYLNDKEASSTWCEPNRNWICSKYTA